MSTRNFELVGIGRHTRLLPGWWLIPSLMVSLAIWAGLIWLLAA